MTHKRYSCIPFISFIIPATLFISCEVHKRHYISGYHLEKPVHKNRFPPHTTIARSGQAYKQTTQKSSGLCIEPYFTGIGENQPEENSEVSAAISQNNLREHSGGNSPVSNIKDPKVNAGTDYTADKAQTYSPGEATASSKNLKHSGPIVKGLRMLLTAALLIALGIIVYLIILGVGGVIVLLIFVIAAVAFFVAGILKMIF